MYEDELEALKKLDEAVQALKNVGYNFKSVRITTVETAGGYKNRTKRELEILGSRITTNCESNQMSEIRKLTTFQGGQIHP